MTTHAIGIRTRSLAQLQAWCRRHPAATCYRTVPNATGRDCQWTEDAPEQTERTEYLHVFPYQAVLRDLRTNVPSATVRP